MRDADYIKIHEIACQQQREWKEKNPDIQSGGWFENDIGYWVAKVARAEGFKEGEVAMIWRPIESAPSEDGAQFFVLWDGRDGLRRGISTTMRFQGKLLDTLGDELWPPSHWMPLLPSLPPHPNWKGKP